MTKQEFLAMSLPYGLKLMQSCKYWATPEADRVVLFTGLSEIDNKMPEQYQNIPCEPTVFYRVNENTTGTDSVSKFKPICRPLSDLTKEIEHKGEKFVPINRFLENIVREWNACNINYPNDAKGLYDDIIKNITSCEFWIIQKLIEWHFNLMDKEEEFIDVNTLKINPYK